MFARFASVFFCAFCLSAASYFTEGFDSVDSLPGWKIVNNSSPGGQTPEGWFQGSGIFLTPAGSPNSYIQANFENAGEGGDISTWLITPLLTLMPGSQLKFYTIGEDVPGFPDRLEVRLSRTGSNVGATPTSVGDFSELLLSVNPELADAGYPTAWTAYTYNFARLTAPLPARLGFRYFVPDRSTNASAIALDSVAVVPEPASVGFTLAGVAFLIVVSRLRRQSLPVERKSS